jgi:hypothetical protein
MREKKSEGRKEGTAVTIASRDARSYSFCFRVTFKNKNKIKTFLKDNIFFNIANFQKKL